MRFKRPYTLYPRHFKSGKVWYASFYNAEGRRVAFSTGETSKARAEAAAVRLLSSPRKAPTLADYAEDFFVWGKCSWLKRQAAKGRGVNEAWAGARRAMLVNHVFARFGKTRLDALTRPLIERWLVDLPRANQTRNHILYALKTVLAEAHADGVIHGNPLEHAEPLGKQARKRDVFSLDELRALFPTDRAGLLAVWGSPKYATLFLTLASTGIREGEARAIQWRHVLPNGWLFVEQAVKQDKSIGTPKNGEVRVTALPARAGRALTSWRAESPYSGPDDLVFFGAGRDRPLNRRTFTDLLGRAFEAAEIETEGRYLTTHSFRHTFNTQMRRSIPADTLRALVGHRDERMTRQYDHPVVADLIKRLEPDRAVIEKALPW
jgi:integrase